MEKMLALLTGEYFYVIESAVLKIQTSGGAPIQDAHQLIFFPHLETRLWIAAMSWMLLGGLAFLLDRVRRRVDQSSGVN